MNLITVHNAAVKEPSDRETVVNLDTVSCVARKGNNAVINFNGGGSTRYIITEETWEEINTKLEAAKTRRTK